MERDGRRYAWNLVAWNDLFSQQKLRYLCDWWEKPQLSMWRGVGAPEGRTCVTERGSSTCQQKMRAEVVAYCHFPWCFYRILTEKERMRKTQVSCSSKQIRPVQSLMITFYLLDERLYKRLTLLSLLLSCPAFLCMPVHAIRILCRCLFISTLHFSLFSSL